MGLKVARICFLEEEKERVFHLFSSCVLVIIREVFKVNETILTDDEGWGFHFLRGGDGVG